MLDALQVKNNSIKLLSLIKVSFEIKDYFKQASFEKTSNTDAKSKSNSFLL